MYMRTKMRESILSYAIRYNGDWTKIANAIRDKEPYVVSHCEYSYVTIVDEEYPDCFKHLRYPPWILFFDGKFDLMKKRCIGIVGSRNCSQKALKNTEIVAKSLKNRYCIVSGLAKGVDAKSHIASMDAYTIGILGCGIDRIYPKENAYLFYEMKKKQLIISEYPPNTPPYARNFPWRNRLIAALSDALIVIEAKHKSGTMLTVNECLELSKPVYCLPTGFEESEYLGCNALIQSGAYLVGSLKDLDEI